MKYQNTNRDIAVGDKVAYAGAIATVVAVGDSAQYGSDFLREDWESQIKNGLLIRFENGALAMLDGPDEDLKFL